MKQVKFIQSLGTQNIKERTAYLRVEVGSKRQVEMVRSGLRKTWIHDSLLKVRTASDAKKESFDNRTIIVSGIPKHLRSEAILEYFTKGAGAVVGIELPT